MPTRVDIVWFWIAPELILATSGVLSLLVAAVQGAVTRPADGKSSRLGAAEWLSIAGVALSGVLEVWVGHDVAVSGGAAVHFWNGLTHDAFSAYFKVAVAVAVLLVMAMMAGYERALFNRPEIYGLLALATLAIFLMASASELVLIFLSLEFLSLTSYVMVGYLKDDARSAEAGVKYFLFGAVCAAIMLYGMSLLYGLTGSTTLQGIAAALGSGTATLRHQMAMVAALLVLAGLGFKISMVPFLQWVPEAYEGAPTPITAFLSVSSKAAGFALAVRVFAVAFGIPGLTEHWAGVIAVLAMVTMTWGNTAAIWQKNIKRMLAYSSIAQAGYMMVGLVSLGLGGSAVREYALPGLLLYVLAYLFMNLGAFSAVIVVSNHTGSDDISAYAGVGQRAPGVAALLTLFFLSLIGIPPTAGFIGKFYLFVAAIRTEPFLPGVPILLAVVMAVNSVVSAFYYLNVVKMMFLRRPEEEAPITPNRALAGTLALAALGTLLVGVWAQPFIDVAQAATNASSLLYGVLGALHAAKW